MVGKRIGSYGWGGRIPETIKGMIGKLINPVIIKGHPRINDYQAFDRLADEILERHRAINIIF